MRSLFGRGRAKTPPQRVRLTPREVEVATGFSKVGPGRRTDAVVVRLPWWHLRLLYGALLEAIRLVDPEEFSIRFAADNADASGLVDSIAAAMERRAAIRGDEAYDLEVAWTDLVLLHDTLRHAVEHIGEADFTALLDVDRGTAAKVETAVQEVLMPDPLTADIWVVSRFQRQLGRILRAPHLAALTGLPVVDVWDIASFTGDPDEPFIWLIVPTPNEIPDRPRRLEAQEKVRDLLRDLGYPASGAATAVVSITSAVDIAEAGGPLNYFR